LIKSGEGRIVRALSAGAIESRCILNGKRAMFLSYLTHPVVIAAIISFFAGSFGYVITVLVIRPLLSYHLLRREIHAALGALAAAPAAGDASKFNAMAVRLTTVYQKNLPQWYKLALTGRQEDPMSAVRHLTRLAKTRDKQQVMARIAAIRSALHLKGSHENIRSAF
jgi:hypothetical protein